MYKVNEITNTILCGDILHHVRQIPDKSIDLIVTSPPYNIKNSSGNGLKSPNKGKWSNAALVFGYETYDDDMPYEMYVAWQRKCLTEMLRVLKDDGAIFYNHKWRVQNGLIQDRHEIIKDFPVRQIIIWKRKGGFNFNPGYFLPTYEVIYLIAKPKFTLVKKANAAGDVWDFGQERKNEHPAPFPIPLVDRILASTSANIILDPFMGSGTTAISAIKNKRLYVGIEISPKYCEMAEKRIQNFLKKPIQKTFFEM